jgi:hypothetical protein
MKTIDPGITGRALNTGPSREHPTEDEIKQLATELGIDLAEIFRPQRAYALFGLKHSQVAEKIKAGEIEPPIPLTESGTAVGWTGRMMVLNHYRRLAAAKKKQIAA